MKKTYEVRIYPNKRQITQLNKNFGCVRFVYNYYLAKQMELQKEGQPCMSYYAMSKDLTKLKKQLSWLQEADSISLQQKLRDLDKAYKRFFVEKKKSSYVPYSSAKMAHFKRIGYIPTLYDSAWHPKFKKKSSHNYSYRIVLNYGNHNIVPNIEWVNKKIKLPKLGWVKIKDNYIPNGRIINATVKIASSGKYFICICCDVSIDKEVQKTNKSIGIDMGVYSFCTFSNGDKEDDLTFPNNSLAKIIKLQKGLARKTRGSSNWEKARVKLAREYEKLSNQKKDYLNKLSTRLVFNYDIICVEDLDIKNMIVEAKGPNMTKSRIRKEILSCSWYEFIEKLKYKADWYDKKIIKVDQFFPSSQICHVCGERNFNIKNKSIREWTCPICGTYHDRDINAAINILNEGLNQK